MIIKKLNIIRYGKFNKKEIELEEGINIIYGENEAGKSTIQSFIKAMLYGMLPQKKSIRESERKRFLPWSGEKAQGEIYIENHKKESFILRKSFGSTKKEDESEILEGVTGEKINCIDLIQPGKDFIGFGMEAFEKTLFVKQLGAEVGRDKEDEIMQRITNLEQGGDENTSYHKALTLLEEAKKTILTLRKTGKLDILRNKLEELNEEFKAALRLSEENIEDQLKFNELCDRKRELQKELNKLEIYKKHIKKLKLQNEYKEICDYLKKSQELNRQKSEVLEDLDNGDNILDENYIQGLKQEFLSYNNIKGVYEQRKDEILKLDSDINEKAEELNRFISFHGLDENVDIKVMSLESERKNLSQRLDELNQCEASLESLENNLKGLKEDLGLLINFEPIRKDLNRFLYEYEEKLKELKINLEELVVLEKVDIKEEKVKSKRNINNILMPLGILILVFSLYNLINPFIHLKSFLNYILALLGISLIFISFKNTNSIHELSIKLNIIKEKRKNIENLNVKIRGIEELLERYYLMIGAEDYKQFILSLKKYDESKDFMDKLKIKIEEKLIQKANYQGETLKENLNKNNKFLEFILSHTESHDIEEFLEKHSYYKEISRELEILQKEKLSCENSLIHLEEDLKNKQSIIKERLKAINKEYIPIEYLEDEIDKLQNKLKHMREIEMQLVSMESSYKVLLKDRDLEYMRAELQDVLEENISEDVKEENLDEELRIKNKELLQTEKDLKDVENLINNRFMGTRSLMDIEESIEEVKNRIVYYEEKVEIIDIAVETLKECFKEMQKNFGPILNEKVAHIFKFLTLDKYEEVKVSEDYSLKVRDKKEEKIVSIDYLSSGSFDQIYFALRMAFIELIFKDTRVPIVLDDAFTQYDDGRLERVLQLLINYSEHKQIIIFTCQKREIEIIKELSKDANIIAI